MLILLALIEIIFAQVLRLSTQNYFDKIVSTQCFLKVKKSAVMFSMPETIIRRVQQNHLDMN